MYSIEKLSQNHVIQDFDCGLDKFSQYLKAYALNDVERGRCTVYVLILMNEPKVVAGYFTLSPDKIRGAILSNAQQRRVYNSDEIPAILIGKIAIDKKHIGKKFSEVLLYSAQQTVLTLEVKSMAITIQALTADLAEYYAKFGFEALPSNKLFLIKTLKRIKADFGS